MPRTGAAASASFVATVSFNTDLNTRSIERTRSVATASELTASVVVVVKKMRENQVCVCVLV